MRFDSLTDACAAAEASGWIEGDVVTALYPSAGADTKPLAFTHPAFYAHRGIGDVPSPNVFVFIDRRGPFPLSFDDPAGATRIGGAEPRPVSVCGVDGLWQELRFESLTGRDDRDPWPPRNVVAVAVGGENLQWASQMRQEGWVPDVFIGVCDGCRFGGTPPDLCVNRLVRHGLSTDDARATRLPRWWITDHFADEQPIGELAVGDCVTSTDPDFPVRFRKRALLSSDWGHYGYGAIPGATLFEVVPARG